MALSIDFLGMNTEMLLKGNRFTVLEIPLDMMYLCMILLVLIVLRITTNLIVANQPSAIMPFARDLWSLCCARNLQVNRQWFQQDDIISQIARYILALLREHFGNEVISHATDFEYPSK
ncbi:hypothetical protein Trydic_g17189 [Trypoxylus dichotomus]